MNPKMIVPMLVCCNAADEIEFCLRAFGAVELSRRTAKDGSVIHSTLKTNESLIMIHNEASHLPSRASKPDGTSSVVIYLYGEKTDTVIEKAAAEGAEVSLPAEDHPWIDRVGRIVDPLGHLWNIANRILEDKV